MVGCGPKYDFWWAKNLEKKGYYVESSLKYEQIVDQYRDNILAPEALYRAGRIYQKKLKLYSKARLFYSALIEQFPKSSPWKDMAQEELFNCPDYFPLNDNNFWMEGDSKTGGRNMRAEWSCKKVSSDTFCITRQMFAGKTFVVKVERYYKKQQMKLCEYKNLKDDKYTSILKYPFIVGNHWQGLKDGKTVYYEIVSCDVPLEVMAGKFEQCLKVSEKYENLPNSIKCNYYAPDVGWVLTTTSLIGGQEFRNSELMAYKIKREKEAK
ncbi:MAG: hypothetical protein LHV68_11700 [Elusimicrobia bacterium]|nr:hypothetical protein [Candidatus Liberimonas magnetica]